MTATTIQDLAQALILAGDRPALVVLKQVVTHIRSLADDEWNKASESWTETSQEAHRAKAHAFCAVLGDQTWLERMGLLYESDELRCPERMT